MKKLLFAFAMASGIGFTTNAALYSAYQVNESMVQESEEGGFVVISEIPKAVAEEIAKRYEGSTIKKAEYDNQKRVYQITLDTNQGEEVVVQVKESGEEVVDQDDAAIQE